MPDSNQFQFSATPAAPTDSASAAAGYVRRCPDPTDYSLRRTSEIEPPVTLELFKKQIRVELDETYEDDLLQVILEDATDYVQLQSDRSICQNVGWLLKLPAFPKGRTVYLPRPTLTSITTVQYYSPDGQLRNLSSVSKLDEHLLSHTGWPATANRPDAVQIAYTAGIANGKMGRRPVLLLAAHWFKHREDSVEKALSTIPTGVHDLIESLRPGDEFTHPVS